MLQRLIPQTMASASSERTPSDEAMARHALDRAETMFGCFRRGEANDPKIYAAAIVRVLANYSEAVIDWVTDPLTGLPSKSDFFPTVKEVKDACDEHAGYLQRLADRDRQREEQFAERDTLAIPDYRPKGPSVRTYTYDEFMAMTNGNGRPIGRFENGTRFAKYSKPVG